MIGFAASDNVDRLWDVLIVGAGVAGSMAAYRAAQMGLSVLLIDKASFPRGKACGCCLNEAAVSFLDDAGLNVRTIGANSVDRFYLACGGSTARISTPPGLAVSREILDVALISHAQKAGAVFIARTAALTTEAFPAFRAVGVVQDGVTMSLRARVVLVADGLSGRLLRAAGGVKIAPHSRVGMAGTLEKEANDYAPGIIYMACGKRGYAGLVIVESGKLHIAAALDVHAVRDASGAGNAVGEIIRESGLPMPEGLDMCRWYGAPALTRRRGTLFDQRLFVIGDASGYVEPFSGEGMAWALASANRITPLIGQAVKAWNSELGKKWELQNRDLIGARQRICRAVTLLLRNQGLTRVAVEALKWSPTLANPLVRAINRPFVLA